MSPARFCTMTTLLALLCAWAGAAESGKPLSDASMQALLAQGEGVFREANGCLQTDPQRAKELYGKAAMCYERIVREGKVRNGGLYYDIGNAYFRMGDIGRAILNYRRAERYLPNDANLQQNLQYARSRRQDRIEEPQRTKVLKTLLFWHYDLSPRTRSVIFLICFLLFWLGALVRIFRKVIVPRWLMALIGTLALLLLGSLVYESMVAYRTNEGVILAKEVVARKGDGQSYQPSFKEPLHAGTEFILTEPRDEWYRIALRDGRQCWIPAKSAEVVW